MITSGTVNAIISERQKRLRNGSRRGVIHPISGVRRSYGRECRHCTHPPVFRTTFTKKQSINMPITMYKQKVKFSPHAAKRTTPQISQVSNLTRHNDHAFPGQNHVCARPWTEARRHEKYTNVKATGQAFNWTNLTSCLCELGAANCVNLTHRGW